MSEIYRFMPELPEVETTRRGIEPFLLNQRVSQVTVHDRRLRWPVARGFEGRLRGQRFSAIGRRSKYLLLETGSGTVMLHLGMSGSLRIVDTGTERKKHDHLEIALASGHSLRFNDPRRFGSAIFTKDPARHRLLKSLGPEPFAEQFTGEYLHEQARGRKVAAKSFIMNAAIVVGVGNIYANEVLFRAGVHPARAAGRISLSRWQRVAEQIRAVLGEAIELGGTTLRDFYGSDGSPGYFQQKLAVYGRADEPCVSCGQSIRSRVLGQRATYYCVGCQR